MKISRKRRIAALGALGIAVAATPACILLGGNVFSLARVSSTQVFPFLKVVGGRLTADPTGAFTGGETPVKILGAAISPAAYGANAGRYNNGTSIDYHDMLWTRVSQKADPAAFIDAIISDIRDAGLNSVRLVLNYCEWGGGAAANVAVGCATTFDATQFNQLIPYLQSFVRKSAAQGIAVEITLFDQFGNQGSDNVENHLWLDALMDAFKDDRNILWSIQNEPMSGLWRGAFALDVATELTRIKTWYEAMADYLRANDLDSRGQRIHMIGINDILLSAVDHFDLSKFDIVFLHHGNRNSAIGSFIDAALFKLMAHGASLSLVYDELACTDVDTGGICALEADKTEYLDVGIRSVNNRLFKSYQGNHFDGAMVWTLYDSCEDIVGCDLTSGSLSAQRSWGIYSCLPDQSCGTRGRVGMIGRLAQMAFKTNFLSLSAPPYQGALGRVLQASVRPWDPSLLNTTLLTDTGPGGASGWNWWAGNPTHMTFGLLDLDLGGGDDSLRVTFTRNFCYGDRQTGPLKTAGGNFTDDDLSDNDDVFLSFDLRDRNGNAIALTHAAFSIGLILGDTTGGGIPGTNTWGGDVTGDAAITDVYIKRLLLDDFYPGHFEFNLSQILRDEGMSGGQLVALQYLLAEKHDTLNPSNNGSCSSTVGYGNVAGETAYVLRNLRLDTYTVSFN